MNRATGGHRLSGRRHQRSLGGVIDLRCVYEKAINRRTPLLGWSGMVCPLGAKLMKLRHRAVEFTSRRPDRLTVRSIGGVAQRELLAPSYVAIIDVIIKSYILLYGNRAGRPLP